jgi:hypothetical protein
MFAWRPEACPEPGGKGALLRGNAGLGAAIKTPLLGRAAR